VLGGQGRGSVRADVDYGESLVLSRLGRAIGFETLVEGGRGTLRNGDSVSSAVVMGG
jgi:hypothetical protein